jgi:hypothetical protein
MSSRAAEGSVHLMHKLEISDDILLDDGGFADWQCGPTSQVRLRRPDPVCSNVSTPGASGGGLIVSVDGPPVAGLAVAMSAPPPVGFIDAVCRVVAVIDEPDRFGFAYGTLPDHPERD